MHWFALIISGVLEAFFPMLMIRSESFTHLFYTPFMLISIITAVILMRYSMKVIPLAVAYIVWTAMGILGTSLIGILLLDEPATVLKLVSLAIIIIAVSGLRITAVISSDNQNNTGS